MVFPLPFTPFEYYFWCDDRPDYPTSFPFELTFSGQLQREPLIRAWTTVVQRHPMLGALVDDTKGRPFWISGNNGQAAPLKWIDQGALNLSCDAWRIDLRTSSGLRAWVRVGQRESRLRLQFHHACCDGLGALQFIEDLLVAYSCEVNGGAGNGCPLRSLDVERLRQRGDVLEVLGDGDVSFAVQLRRKWIVAREWMKLLMRNPMPLASPNASHGFTDWENSSVDFVTRALDVDMARKLRHLASACQATLNDVLLRDLFQVTNHWNQQYGKRRGKWLRINIPVNLRVRDDRSLPAANRLSYAFLTRRTKDCRDAAGLLASIRDETSRIKRDHLSLCFLGGLMFASVFKGMMPWFLNRNRSFATIVLSNLGRVLAKTPLPREQGRLVCGNAVLERISAVPPIRPLTRASIVVLMYADELTLNLRCDPRFFSPAQTNQLLDAYLARLGQSCDQKC